jgi:hypothetical protein
MGEVNEGWGEGVAFGENSRRESRWQGKDRWELPVGSI